MSHNANKQFININFLRPAAFRFVVCHHLIRQLLASALHGQDDDGLNFKKVTVNERVVVQLIILLGLAYSFHPKFSVLSIYLISYDLQINIF